MYSQRKSEPRTPRFVALLVVLATFALSGMACGQSIEELPAGTTIKSGYLLLGKRKILLPPGEWTLLAKMTDVTKLDSIWDDAKTASAYLISSKDGVFRAGMRVSGTISPGKAQRWLDDPCKRTDTLYRDPFGGTYKYPECLLINHYVEHLVKPDGWLSDAVKWKEENKISVPSTVIAATYSKFYFTDYVSVTYYVNPELAGIAPSARTPWSENDWHKIRIDRDPAKVAYVKSFAAWALHMASAYRFAMTGSGDDAPTSLPDFPSQAK